MIEVESVLFYRAFDGPALSYGDPFPRLYGLCGKMSFQFRENRTSVKMQTVLIRRIALNARPGVVPDFGVSS